MILAKRFFSFLIDYLIIIPFSMILTLFLLIKTGMCDNIGLSLFTTIFLYINPFLIINMPNEAIPIILFCSAFPAITMYCLYCLLLELCFNKTIGQKIQNIAYVNERKERLSRKQILDRNFLKYISLILGFVGIMSIPFSNKPLYDILLKVDMILM